MPLLFASFLLCIQDPKPLHTNRLINETSPYLLQHANNPVDWFPWGEEAIKKAKNEGKPIFLSIGYSACHWCHVMERESFEDEAIAKALNKYFISIKIDREERPDLDDFYMAAVQRMTGSGGWPMSVFLTTELKPFYGGTYFPPQAKWGKPGFLELTLGIANAWEKRQDEIQKTANGLTQSLEIKFPDQPEIEIPQEKDFAAMTLSWLKEFENAFDSTWGGFSKAPKFPPAENIRWLLSISNLSSNEMEKAHKMAYFTLRKMASGGMYDQIGGGFSRYSVDEQWLIPHFEKMLYDQGTLIPAYIDAWKRSKDKFFRQITDETIEYLLREMRHEEGAFFSSTDADSEGEEGKFFAWSPKEIINALGEIDGQKAISLFGISDQGNFEHGRSVLTRTNNFDSPEALRLRQALYNERLKRIPPATDDKILTAWNGLVIDALAQAGLTFGNHQYIIAAENAAKFLLKNLRVEGSWRRAWRNQKSQHPALLEDHAYIARGLLSLFQATGKIKWLREAEKIALTIVENFGDSKTGIFWDSDGLDDTLIQRRKSPWDGAIPSPNAVTFEIMLKLHAFTQSNFWENQWELGLAALLPMCKRNPRGFAGTLRHLALAIEGQTVALVVGRPGANEWRKAIMHSNNISLLPVFLEKEQIESELSLFKAKPTINDKATLYICRGKTCEAPINHPKDWLR